MNNLDKKTELTKTICKMIVRDEEINNLDYDSLTIIVDVSVGCISNSGFAYVGEEIIPICVGCLEFDDCVEELRKELVGKDGKMFCQMLIQIRKADGKLNILFEFDDPNKWSIGPGSLIEMKEKLRPQFD